MRGAITLLALSATLAVGASTVSAAGPPVLGAAWTSDVFSNSARLHGEVNPNGLASAYHFEYISATAYEANVAAGKDGFDGAAKAPSGTDPSIGSGSTPVAAQQLVAGGLLIPEAAYRYRIVAKNSAGTATGLIHAFTTRPILAAGPLLDGRGWEMVSPVDKNGGQVDPPGALAAGGVLQAAANGSSVTYGSVASFGVGAQGAPPASQYVSSRAAGGWSTQNVTPPVFSGSYHVSDAGVPYQLFSGDLARGLLLNGEHCRGEGSGCAVANPPLPDTEAPAGYQDYYLREGGGYASLLGAADLLNTSVGAARFDLAFAGASPDLRHVVLSTCAALTPNATEVALGEDCDPSEANLYEFSSGAGLSLVNVKPAQSQGAPGAALGAQSGAVSTDGLRVYWSEAGTLYLRKGGTGTSEVASGAEFQTASSDGSVALYTKGGHLFRYEAAGAGSSTDLTPSGGVIGVLGASEDGSHVYYLTASGLFLNHAGATTKVADGADAGNYPPTTGTARVSADGARLLFVSTTPLTGYDNTDLLSGDPDSEVYLYAAAATPPLACISCNPTNERPLGPSTIPGAIANGGAPGSTHSYKPRALSDDGRRAFFESGDAIAATDTNSDTDVYEWEAQGTGSCTRSGGCMALVSSGRAEGGATFVDASADGADAFFLTDGSLASADPGSVDLYDARVGGGFPEPSAPTPCEGDACQVLPPEPTDPTLTTLLAGLGNPPVRYRKGHRPKAHHRARHHRHRGSRR